MTFGQLFKVMNPEVVVRKNGTCIWLYFDDVNYYTIGAEWWDKEIPDNAITVLEEHEGRQSGMTNVKAVFEQLLHCKVIVTDEDMYYYVVPYDVYKDICNVLKEQEPHVLSKEEMIEAGKNHDAVFVEEGVGRCFWGLAVEGMDPPEDKPYNYPGGVFFNVVDADGDMWDGDFYLMCDVYPEIKPHPMGWRAWSAKPTEERRLAVKWDE